MKKYLILVMMLFTLSAWGSVKEVHGKHGEMGFACTVCHGDTTSPMKRPPVSTCLQCHKSYEHIASLTANLVPNPHQSHQGEVRCTLCHKSHEPSVLYCNECHQFDLKFD